MGLFITPSIEIADDEIEERFIRASGPGGQNVNKVESAVQLRFNVLASRALNHAQKSRLQRLAGARLNRDGEIVITARSFRDQQRNRADARARLAVLVLRALHPPKPRYATKVPFSQKKKRLNDKKRRGDIKSQRRRPIDDGR